MDDKAKLPYTWQTLKTERLTMRLMTADDIDDVFAYQSREDVCRYLLFDPRTRDEVAERNASNRQATTVTQDDDWWQIALELATPERTRVIGDLYFTIKSVENSHGEIGWTLHPDFAGQGYAFEGAQAVLAVAFDTLGLHRVTAELDPRNDRSIALCTRLGLREEAYYREDLWFRGAWADTGVYAILNSEYRNLHHNHGHNHA